MRWEAEKVQAQAHPKVLPSLIQKWLESSAKCFCFALGALDLLIRFQAHSETFWFRFEDTRPTATFQGA